MTNTADNIKKIKHKNKHKDKIQYYKNQFDANYNTNNN